MQSAPAETSTRYIAPDWVTRHVFNPIVANLARLGIGIRGARELHVKGRVSGEWRTVPVNPLSVDGLTYLVAPRGDTEWVRNLRVAGAGRLRKGRRIDTFSAREVGDEHKVPILRAYLAAWGFEVGKFFEGVDADSSDEQLAAIAPGFPVFSVN